MTAPRPFPALLPARSLSSGQTRSSLDRQGLPVPHAPLRTLLPELPRGGITELLGQGSCGRTALAHSLLAAATHAGEVTAVIDFASAFDPLSAEAAGADLGQVLWIRTGERIDAAFRAADLLLHGGGFGLVWLDLCDVPQKLLQQVPTSYWYRFRRAVENTPTVLLVSATEPQARACAVRQIDLGRQQVRWQGRVPFQRLEAIEVEARLRKPFRPLGVAVAVQAA